MSDLWMVQRFHEPPGRFYAYGADNRMYEWKEGVWVLYVGEAGNESTLNELNILPPFTMKDMMEHDK